MLFVRLPIIEQEVPIKWAYSTRILSANEMHNATFGYFGATRFKGCQNTHIFSWQSGYFNTKLTASNTFLYTIQCL